ncbi:MAG: Nramp family divalent metal transporter, partial [Rhodobacteraceae bacterium]|nr:Nramp family divalent metal transporter [Paracoccaceae bacterium]
DPPTPRGLGWVGVVGPGVIVLGASIGGGEYLLGPTVFVRHGLTLLWVTTIAVFFQTIFNTELMRYTLATGEPAFTGFMRTKPARAFWSWFYVIMYLLQVGWPYSAGLSPRAASGSTARSSVRNPSFRPRNIASARWLGVLDQGSEWAK